MQILGKLLFVLIASSSGVLAGILPDLGELEKRGNDDQRGGNDEGGNDDGCPGGGRRNPATAISQAGPQPYCSNYVRISTYTETKVVATTTVSYVTTKTVSHETDVTTTVQKTSTATAPTVLVTTTIPATIGTTVVTTTTTTLPPHTVTSIVLVKRNDPEPKCSCILLLTTKTVSSTVTKTVLSTISLTTTKSETHTKSTTLTTTSTPTVTTVITTISTLTTLTTATLTNPGVASTTIWTIPSACAGDLTAPPVNLAANAISHPEGTYTSIYSGQGLALSSVIACCIECYKRPGCFGFDYSNFDPLFEAPLGNSYCQVWVGIGAEMTCPATHKSNIVLYNNPSVFGLQPTDFMYAATGPCSGGIDFSTIP